MREKFNFQGKEMTPFNQKLLYYERAPGFGDIRSKSKTKKDIKCSDFLPPLGEGPKCGSAPVDGCILLAYLQ